MKNCSTKFRYVLTGNGCKAVPVHSDLNYTEMCDYIREHSSNLHPDGHETIFRIGIIEFVNPQVRMVDDFADSGPYLIGIK